MSCPSLKALLPKFLIVCACLFVRLVVGFLICLVGCSFVFLACWDSE